MRRALLVSAAFVAGAAVLGLGWLRLGTLSGGPMIVPNEHGWAVDIDQGDRFTDGFEVVEVDGDQPAVLERVEQIGGDGLVLFDVKVAGPDRDIGAVQLMRTWPPRDEEYDLGTVEDAAGATIRPGRSFELLLGYEVVGHGRLVREGLRITYRVGGSRYTTEFPAILIVCTAEARDADGNCPLTD